MPQKRNPMPAPFGGENDGGTAPQRQPLEQLSELVNWYKGRNDLWAPPPAYPVRVTVYKGTTKGGKPIVREIFEGRPTQVKRAMVAAGYYDMAHSGLDSGSEDENDE